MGAALDFSKIKFDAKGLVPAVAQDATTGKILMLAYANREALETTEREGLATWWSRSRNELWTKGLTSGHTMRVREILIDCDGDALIYKVDPSGPACHTGEETCFFRRNTGEGWEKIG